MEDYNEHLFKLFGYKVSNDAVLELENFYLFDLKLDYYVEGRNPRSLAYYLEKNKCQKAEVERVVFYKKVKTFVRNISFSNFESFREDYTLQYLFFIKVQSYNIVECKEIEMKIKNNICQLKSKLQELHNVDISSQLKNYNLNFYRETMLKVRKDKIITFNDIIINVEISKTGILFGQNGISYHIDKITLPLDKILSLSKVKFFLSWEELESQDINYLRSTEPLTNSKNYSIQIEKQLIQSQKAFYPTETLLKNSFSSIYDYKSFTNKLVAATNITFYCYYSFDNYDLENISKITCKKKFFKPLKNEIEVTFEPNIQVYCYYYPNDEISRFVQFYKKFEDVNDKIIIIFNERKHFVIFNDNPFTFKFREFLNDQTP